jgi:hypothetical protein
MRFLIARSTLMASLLVATSVTQGSEGSSPASLLVYPKAEQVRYDDKDGAWWVYYSVQAEYPAEGVLRFIRTELKRQGWWPLKEDVLNPGLPSSHVTGWQDYVDSRTSPKTQVRKWIAQWKNARGDVVWYVLKYQYPKGTLPIPKTVNVMGNYYPARLVQLQQQWAEEERRKTQKQE